MHLTKTFKLLIILSIFSIFSFGQKKESKKKSKEEIAYEMDSIRMEIEGQSFALVLFLYLEQSEKKTTDLTTLSNISKLSPEKIIRGKEVLLKKNEIIEENGSIKFTDKGFRKAYDRRTKADFISIGSVFKDSYIQSKNKHPAFIGTTIDNQSVIVIGDSSKVEYKYNSDKAENDSVPKGYDELIIQFFFKTIKGKFILFLFVVAFVLFAIWKSLTDSIKEKYFSLGEKAIKNKINKNKNDSESSRRLHPK